MSKIEHVQFLPRHGWVMVIPFTTGEDRYYRPAPFSTIVGRFERRRTTIRNGFKNMSYVAMRYW